MKQAIILAAGRGLRLNGCSNGRPKCLAEVGGKTLIQHQLDLLSSFGIQRTCVVVGFNAEVVGETVNERCCCIMNSRYAETNSLYSFWLCREWVSDSIVVLNCDVLPDPRILAKLLAVEGSAFTYDSSSGDEDEHMKVALRENGCLEMMSKGLESDKTMGENVGMLQFDRAAADLLFAEATALIQAGHRRDWLASAVSQIAPRTLIQGVDIAGLPWTEIDFPEDLVHAREVVWPSVREAYAELAGHKTTV